jgi:hypothetical protein
MELGKANYVLFGQRDIARWASESYLVGIWLTRQKRMKWIGDIYPVRYSTVVGNFGMTGWGVGAWGGWIDGQTSVWVAGCVDGRVEGEGVDG